MANTEVEFKEATFEDYTTVAAVAGHTVVTRANGTLGITREAIDALGTGSIITKGRERQNKAAVAITLGQMLFWDATNLCVTNLVSGQYIGIAAEAAASGAADIAFDLNEVPAIGNIAVYGSAGNFKATYPTIDLAVAALANSDILKLKAGEYTLSGAVNITATDVQIIGDGGVTIVGAADADYCFKTVFGAISSTKGVTFKNLTISHGDDATQIGVEIANVAATGRINAIFENVSFESDGGNSIQVDHSATAASVRLYVTGGTIEGPVNYTVGNTDDRIRFEGSTLRGGLVTGASATAMEIELWNCKVLHEGVTGGNAAQLLYALYCLSETDANPNVYAALDTNDLAGSHTESVLFPAS